MLSGSIGQFPLRQGISEASRAREFLGSGLVTQAAVQPKASEASCSGYGEPSTRDASLIVRRHGSFGANPLSMTAGALGAKT